MRINILSFWICSSVLVQTAFGSNVTDSKLSTSTVSTDTHISGSALSENLDVGLSHLTDSSLPTQEKIALGHKLQTMLHQYDTHVKELEHTIETYDTTAREAIEVFDTLSAELALCKVQDKAVSPSQLKAVASPFDKRHLNLYRSYIALKPQFNDAIKILKTRFPGFKYNPKNFAGLADQFESWAKTELPAAPSKS